MADIFEMLTQLLCYGNNDCISQAQQYAYKPMEGLFYVVFFPAIFILLFIFIVSSSISPNRGFRALISFAVFAFIILQGWYGMFMMMSQFWMISLIFLGFIWFAAHNWLGPKGGGGGGGAKGRSFGDGLGGKVLARAWKKVSGEETSLVHVIEADLDLLENLDVEDRHLAEVTQRILQQLRDLYEMTNIGGVKVMSHYNRLLNRYHQLARKKGIKQKHGYELPKAG